MIDKDIRLHLVLSAESDHRTIRGDIDLEDGAQTGDLQALHDLLLSMSRM
jgi:hypothetical protein